MPDEFDVRIAELQLMQAQEKTLQNKTDANAKKTVGFFNFVVGGIVGALAAYATAYLNYSGEIEAARLEQANIGREIDLELAKLSLTILSGEYDKDDADNSLPARMFALRALSRGTGVEIPEEDMSTWAERGTTPAADQNIWGLAMLDAAKFEAFTQLNKTDEFERSVAAAVLQSAVTAGTLNDAEEYCTAHRLPPRCGLLLNVDFKSGKKCIAVPVTLVIGRENDSDFVPFCDFDLIPKG